MHLLLGKQVDVIYYIEKLSTNGACEANQVQLPPGIVADWAYDPITQTAYAALVTNGDNYVYSIDVTTSEVIRSVDVSRYLPESLEFAYV